MYPNRVGKNYRNLRAPVLLPKNAQPGEFFAWLFTKVGILEILFRLGAGALRSASLDGLTYHVLEASPPGRSSVKLGS